MLKIKMLK